MSVYSRITLAVWTNLILAMLSGHLVPCFPYDPSRVPVSRGNAWWRIMKGARC